MGRECSTHGAKRNAYRVLGEGKRPPGKPGRRREDNTIKMYLVQDRYQWRSFVDMVMNHLVP
jgi:hypothetical protein